MKCPAVPHLCGVLTTLFVVTTTLLSGCTSGSHNDKRENNDSGEVETSYGIVAGVRNETISYFLGIPYALPPVGDLRWTDPQPPALWHGVFQATQFKAACFQTIQLLTLTLPEQEDCLTLNIWRPNTTGRHPVMFWVHGGGNETGSAAEPLYDGGKLAQALDVVFVSVDYRLNALGFLALPSINGAPAINGNQGIKDQIAALQWVQDEIAHFGGDPDNVTVIGHSGGATDVCALLATPKTSSPKPLLHKVIMQGGACETLKITDLATAQQQGLDYINSRGCTDALDKLACARALPAQREPTFKSLLVIDGDVLPQHPLELLANSDKTDTPLLIGTNKDEGSVQVGYEDHPSDESGYIALLAKEFPSEENALAALYPYGDYPTSGQAHADLVGDHQFHCTALETAHAWSAHDDAWFYHFTYDVESAYTAITSSLFGENGPALGTFHGAELAYLFNYKFYQTQDADASQMLITLFQDAWSNFVHTGNPNGDTVPQWDAFDSTRDNYLNINTTQLNRDGLRANYCEYWIGRNN